MAQQFIRQANITATSEAGLQRTFSGLRVQFKFMKTSSSSPNRGTVKIFNLNKDSRTFLEGSNVAFKMDVGYLGNEEQMLRGVVAKAVSIRKLPDWITEVEVGDGEKKLREANIQKSWGVGTPFATIIQQAVSALGLTTGSQIIPVTEIATEGYSFGGSAKDLVDYLAKRFGLSWSVQDEAVNITPKDLATLETVVVVSPTTGLLGNIEKQGTTTTSGDDAKIRIQFKNLLNPQIRPGRTISVLGSEEIVGLFKCQRAMFEGDTHGEKWLTAVEAVQL